jgi:hypothetical protein
LVGGLAGILSERWRGKMGLRMGHGLVIFGLRESGSGGWIGGARRQQERTRGKEQPSDERHTREEGKIGLHGEGGGWPGALRIA